MPIVPLADAIAKATEALAILTGVLAGATFVLAAITYWGIRSARADADRQIRAGQDTAAEEIETMRATTAEQVAAARAELDASHRPLLIEVLPDGPITADMGARSNPDLQSAPGREIPLTIQIHLPNPVEIDPRHVFVNRMSGDVWVSIALRNVGRGLAMIDENGISISGHGLSQASTITVSRTRVPVGETTRITVGALFDPGYLRDDQERAWWGLEPESRWLIGVPYTDFAGRQPTVATVSLAVGIPAHRIGS